MNKCKITYDGDEMRDLRNCIPSSKRNGKMMGVVELAAVIGVDRRTISNWERNGGTQMQWLSILGAKQITDSSFDIEEERQSAELIADELHEIESRKQDILKRISK